MLRLPLTYLKSFHFDTTNAKKRTLNLLVPGSFHKFHFYIVYMITLKTAMLSILAELSKLSLKNYLLTKVIHIYFIHVQNV